MSLVLINTEFTNSFINSVNFSYRVQNQNRSCVMTLSIESRLLHNIIYINPTIPTMSKHLEDRGEEKLPLRAETSSRLITMGILMVVTLIMSIVFAAHTQQCVLHILTVNLNTIVAYMFRSIFFNPVFKMQCSHWMCLLYPEVFERECCRERGWEDGRYMQYFCKFRMLPYHLTCPPEPVIFNSWPDKLCRCRQGFSVSVHISLLQIFMDIDFPTLFYGYLCGGKSWGNTLHQKLFALLSPIFNASWRKFCSGGG